MLNSSTPLLIALNPYSGTSKEGCGGLGEQIGHQNLGSSDIALKVKQMIK